MMQCNSLIVPTLKIEIMKTIKQIVFCVSLLPVSYTHLTKRAVINVEEPALDRWSELLPDPQETLDITLYPEMCIRDSVYSCCCPK